MSKEDLALVALVVMTLEKTEKWMLGAANSELCLNGHIRSENLAYDFFLSKDLIMKNGRTILDLPIVVKALEYLISIPDEASPTMP